MEQKDNIWFTADLHLLHPKIVKITGRPIDIKDHDQWIINNINSCVKKNDRLYILGDVSMGNKLLTESLVSKINGHKYLIPGNHDKNIKNSTLFVSIDLIKNFSYYIEDSSINIVLCHYPLASWENKVHGAWHLHGHTHGRFENKGLSFDVGLDANNYLPINLEEVEDRITKISLNYF